MNSIVKWAAIAAGAYWLYESGLLSSFGLAPAAASTSTGSTAAPPSNPTGAPPTNPASSSTPTKALVLAAAQAATGVAAPLLSFDQWNNIFQGKVRGVPGPDPSRFLSAANRSENLSIDEWWADMQQAGFSGLVRGGMGGFVNREMQYTFENPYTPPPEGLVAIPRV